MLNYAVTTAISQNPCISDRKVHKLKFASQESARVPAGYLHHIYYTNNSKPSHCFAIFTESPFSHAKIINRVKYKVTKL